eukprot:3815446-Pyramimonas_sp.AAC.2
MPEMSRQSTIPGMPQVMHSGEARSERQEPLLPEVRATPEAAEVHGHRDLRVGDIGPGLWQ